ncbi:MAG: CaiB/BaiF CoA transferase family protein [Dehalococcoidia bacterium]
MKPLTGIRVLDLTWVLAGPFCTMMLGDYGAEVIKVERPGKGDVTRGYGPFIDGESTYFMSINRNKKSITLDLQHPKGQEIAHRIAQTAGVVVENFAPGVAQRLRMDYATLRQVNPRIVYCSISGFGQTGPYEHKPAYDMILQAMGGLMSVTGEPDGPPMKVGLSVVDISAGMYAAFGILTALVHRDHTGVGQHVDVSMLDGQVYWMSFLAGSYLATGKVPPRYGNRHPVVVPVGAFRTKDGYVAVNLEGDRFRVFCQLVGREDLPERPEYQTPHDRVAHRQEVEAVVQEELLKRTTEEWLRELEALRIPVGPIYDMKQLLSDPHVLHREMVAEAPHPKLGKVKVAGIPVKLSASPGAVESGPPLLSQHTVEVLGSIGYSAGELEHLRQEGVI